MSLLLAACLAACGDQNVITPRDVAGNYVYAIAEGNYQAACAQLDTRTRDRLARAAGPHGTCTELLSRCLPGRFRSSAGDQSQLLYAGSKLRERGRSASVTLGGTAAARATRFVTLSYDGSRWLLTSPGAAITRCLSRISASQRRAGRRVRR